MSGCVFAWPHIFDSSAPSNTACVRCVRLREARARNKSLHFPLSFLFYFCFRESRRLCRSALHAGSLCTCPAPSRRPRTRRLRRSPRGRSCPGRALHARSWGPPVPVPGEPTVFWLPPPLSRHSPLRVAKLPAILISLSQLPPPCIQPSRPAALNPHSSIPLPPDAATSF